VVDEDQPTDAEIERTRAEIERTRADMSETVDAIQERLSPENLKEQAKDRVREATVGRAQEAGSGIVETIRANPVPAALTGIGLGWLLVSAGRSSSSAQARYGGKAYSYPPTYDYSPRYEEQGAEGPPQARLWSGPVTRSERLPAKPKTGQERSPTRPRIGLAAWASRLATRLSGPAAASSGCSGRTP